MFFFSLRLRSLPRSWTAPRTSLALSTLRAGYVGHTHTQTHTRTDSPARTHTHTLFHSLAFFLSLLFLVSSNMTDWCVLGFGIEVVTAIHCCQTSVAAATDGATTTSTSNSQPNLIHLTMCSWSRLTRSMTELEAGLTNCACWWWKSGGSELVL